ncbi:hypothetical protein ACT4JQ_004807 [Yersinia enterocolitica]|nr:hypothetical protein [Yersinia enterocolitica]
MNNIEELREHCEEIMAISPLRYAYIPASSIITLIDRIVKAEAALSAANEKLSKPVVLPPRRSASYFVDEEFSNEDLAAIYNAARLEFSVKVKNAGFTVEGE